MGNPFLASEIISKIKSKQKITFAEFMEMALYHPSYGYYTSLKDRMGDRVDFITSPEVHAVFGRLVAKQIAEVQDHLSIKKERFWILEIGAGHGLLCRDILSALREEFPGLYKNINYGIVERSPSLLKRQREIILDNGEWVGTVSWFGSINEGPLKEGIKGCIVTNEFFDALPVHRVRKEKGLVEIYVCYNKGFQEVLDSPSTPALENYFKDLGIELQEGMEAEVNLMALDWIKRMGKVLKRGVIITIDYGYPARELYSIRHFKGTLMCYYRHRIEENPFIRLGLQDITSHIDFTSLVRVGEKYGLSVTGFTDQGSFLLGLGVLDELQALGEDSLEDRMAVKSLFMPGGFGDTFKVLIQHKGLERPSLKGLSFKNMVERLYA